MTASCGLCERPLPDGGYLCQLCAKNTTVRLECLPELHAALAAFLAPGRRGAGQATRAGRIGPSMPVSEDVLDHRVDGGIVSLVEDWRAAMHADIPGWPKPETGGTIEQRIARAAAGLRANMLWIADSWPAAGAFAEEIRDKVNEIRSIIDPRDPRDRGRRLGDCPAAYDDNTLCGAALRLYPGEQAVTCRGCGTIYPQAVWAGLKALMDHDAATAA